MVSVRQTSAIARTACVALAFVCYGSGLAAQRGGGGGGGRGRGGADANAPAGPDTTGFIIREQAIIDKCTDCHARDNAGYISRISYSRKTPEGWETSVRRMATLNNVKLDPATARTIVRYLSDNQGLAPAELRPARFEVERRTIDFRYTADPRTETTCRACHSIGRVMTQRRTRSEWELLVATHRALYPDADFQAFRRGGPSPADSAPVPHPMDAAISHLARVFPLRTPEWAAWSATMRSPRIEGTWLLSGTEAGHGQFTGRVTISRGATESEFVTTASYRYSDGGAVVHRTGKSIVYTGYQWRGRSTDPALRARDTTGVREVMFIEPGWQEMSGRWFSGAYDELGMDISMKRLGANPIVAAVAPRVLRAGARGVDLTILGANLPREATGIDFGPGITVERVVRATPDSVTVRVNVDTTAQVGARDLFAAGASLRDAAVVYDQIDRIKVTPLAGMGRVGGVVFPKQLQQFDAIAYSNGADKKPDTDDDIEIGRVPAKWSVEEYATTYDDDDMKFVGTLDQNGLFTPALDGPNPQRTSNRNNIGDVWVVATYQPPAPTKVTRPLKARAHLLVTVPLYVRWEPWRSQP